MRIDARKVIMRLLNSSEKLYEGIQVVNHIITVAATKSTTESVYNSNSWKNYREQAMRDSFEVQKDGRTGLCSPDVTAWSRLSLTNILVTKNGWHFIMSENLLKTSKLILRSDQRRTAPMLGDCKFPRSWWFHTDNL